jgi:D-alanyl-D-alanine carboxypeptidase (penicillin-binding protein 5/6)
MHDTTFTNETGLDIEHDTVATNFGSARDVATLLTYIITHEPRLLEATEDDREKLYSVTGTVHTAVTTNKALADIPGLIGGKTGFTDVAGGNLAIAFDVEPGHSVVAVVLGSGKDERFSDMLTLVDSVRNQFGMIGERQAHMPL